MKLHQVIALVAGRKTAIQKLLTTLHHGWRAERMMGITRTYLPKDQEGERFPSETKVLQLRVSDELAKLRDELSAFWDLVCMQEAANTEAKNHITVDGMVLAEDVPVSALLFLEKQLTDLATLLSAVPTLPIDKQWAEDKSNRCYISAPEETVKTKKVQRPLVLYPATPEHPAQTQLVTEDVTIGNWTTVHSSGAIPESEQHAMLKRVERLRDAVRVAREGANDIEAQPFHVENLLNWILDG
jgi:hypothetical protein